MNYGTLLKHFLYVHTVSQAASVVQLVELLSKTEHCGFKSHLRQFDHFFLKMNSCVVFSYISFEDL